MKAFGILLAAGVLGVFLISPSCDDSSGAGQATRLCQGWCEAELEGLDDCLGDVGCEIDDLDEQISDCTDECLDTLKDQQQTERQEAYECLGCLAEEAGDDPDCDDYYEAYSDCEDECYEEGALDFFNDLDFEADVSCPDLDVDTDSDGDWCPGYTGTFDCCKNNDPCDWADDGVCDCDDTCWWDVDDCYDYYF